MELKFYDAPPRPLRPRSKNAAIYEALRTNPNKWALVFETQIKREADRLRVAICHYRDEYEARVHTRDDGIIEVWASYQPE